MYERKPFNIGQKKDNFHRAAKGRSGENNRELLLSSWLHSQMKWTSQVQGRRHILQSHPAKAGVP